MSDQEERPPSRLEMLRFARRVAEQHLAQINRWIVEEEQREAEAERRQERAHAERRWKIEPQHGDRPALLHRGGCTRFETQVGYLDREEALIALAEPDIQPCEVCQPETGLRQG